MAESAGQGPMASIDDTKATLFASMYERFNARDIEALLEMLTPDVDWPNGWEGGYLHGHDEVRDYWTRQWSAIDSTVTPGETSALPDGRIDVTVQQVVKDLDGELINAATVHHVYRLRGEKVEHMEIREPASADPGTSRAPA